jgi:hypothetical protein
VSTKDMNDPWGSPRLDSTVINRQFPRRVNKKIVISGSLLEVFDYEKPLVIENGVKNNPNKGESSIRNSEYKARSIHKAQTTIKRLVQSNFNSEAKFLTLTFNNDCDFDITSIDECDVKFRLFIRSLNRRYPNLEYTAVREFQKRGAIHYHLIVNLPYILNDELAEIWGHGFIKIRKVSNVFGIGFYLSKYLKKEFADPRFKGKKAYITSRNLKKPLVYYGDEARSILEEILKSEDQPKYKDIYQSEYNGVVNFSEYNLTQPVLSKEKLNEIRNIFEKI